jgi:hypothetical protein
MRRAKIGVEPVPDPPPPVLVGGGVWDDGAVAVSPWKLSNGVLVGVAVDVGSGDFGSQVVAVLNESGLTLSGTTHGVAVGVEVAFGQAVGSSRIGESVSSSYRHWLAFGVGSGDSQPPFVWTFAELPRLVGIAVAWQPDS